VHWINLAQDMDKWRDFANMVMNVRFPLNAENFSKSSASTRYGRALLYGGSQLGFMHYNLTYKLAIQQILMDISRAVCIYISQSSEFNWPFVVKRLPVNRLTELS
jgi:hypothetical protein